jgi:hypothetical protein
MISQLVYISNRDASCSNDEIERILESCKKNNPSLDITGVLLYNDSKFIQLVEGDLKTLLSLYDKIKLDSRHNNPVLISCRPVKEKTFPSWHMASRKMDEDKMVKFKSNISNEDRIVFNNILEGKEENGQKVLDLLKKFFDK